MRTIIVSMVALLLVVPVTGYAQDTRATLERAAAAMGASGLTTLEYTAAGTMFDVGQSAVPGQRGPQFTIKSYTRSVNYETTSVRTDLERARAEARGGGSPAPRQIWMVSGDHAWNVVGDTAARPCASRSGAAPVRAVDHPARDHQGRDEIQRHGRGSHDLVRRPRSPSCEGDAHRGQPRRQGRGRHPEPGGR